MTTYLGPGLLAILITLILTPMIRHLAVRTDFVDYPGERRVHKTPLAMGGGVAIYASFWLALWFAGEWTSQLLGLWFASTLVLLTGLIDDRRTLSPGAKLFGQILASLVLIASGTRIEFVTNPFGGMLYLSYWSIPVTLLWLVTLTNLVNFIDGLDGLAAGVVTIACAPLAAVALMMDQPLAALLAVVLAGSVVGFLPYNFNPARIIMGDTGALFLGFMLGAISVEGALKGPTVIAIAVSTLALGLPILDTLFSILRRWRAGRPIYLADNGHVHHRLLAMGYSHRQAVMMLYAVSAGLAAVAMWLLRLPVAHTLLIVSLGVMGIVLIGATLKLQAKEHDEA